MGIGLDKTVCVGGRALACLLIAYSTQASGQPSAAWVSSTPGGRHWLQAAPQRTRVTLVSVEDLPPTRPAGLDLTWSLDHQPRMPIQAVRDHHYGTVVLRARVNADGLVVATQVQQSSGYPELDSSAVTAVSQWRYAPCFKDGIPVACWVTQPVTFAPAL